jgi:hypothetical protein
VGALGGGFKNTEVTIHVVCSLELAKFDKKFELPFESSEDMSDVFESYNYFAAGAGCPLDYSMK